MKDYVLNASVALLRNYADLHFDAAVNVETAKRVNERALVALERSGESYAYLVTADMVDERREELVACRLLSEDAHENVSGAAYLRMDERVCVETSGADHLRIAAYDPAGNLRQCLDQCRELAKKMEDTGVMAYSERFGFLTAQPCDAGNGMRVALSLHLPMTQLAKQAPAAIRMASSDCSSLRLAGSGVYLLENRVNLGWSESQVLDQIQLSVNKLCGLERTLRWKAREQKDLNVADKAWRAYATARYALRIGVAETLQLWSAMTLGAAVLEMPYSEKTLDRLWDIAHMTPGKLTEENDLQPDVARAMRVRALFGEGD